MKKAIFLPMMAIFTLIIVGIIAYTFNQNEVSKRNEIVGEKAAFVIKSIIGSEKDYFFVQDSAKLAYCDALNKMAEETGLPANCIKGGYPVWDFTPNCNPSDNFETKFSNYFNEYFDNYLKQNVKLKELKYKFTKNKEGFSITTEPIKIEDKDDKNTIYTNYNFNPIFTTKIDSNLEDYINIINNAKNYLNCMQKGGSVDKCNVETHLNGIINDNLIKFDISSIKNPCNLQGINIRFALDTSSENGQVTSEVKEKETPQELPKESNVPSLNKNEEIKKVSINNEYHWWKSFGVEYDPNNPKADNFGFVCPLKECCIDSNCGENKVCKLGKCVTPIKCEPLDIRGDTKDKVDIVFVDEVYNNELFNSDLDLLLGRKDKNIGFFSIEPFKSNRNKFNLWVISEEALTSEYYIRPYTYPSEALKGCPQADIIAEITEEPFDDFPVYGGDGNIHFNMKYMKRNIGYKVDGSREDPFLNDLKKYDGLIIQPSEIGAAFAHEFGHAFAGLQDEYFLSLGPPTKSDPYKKEGLKKNCWSIMDGVCEKYSWWMLSGIKNTGCYEGCTLAYGLYRSKENTLMRYEFVPGADFGEVNELLINEVLDHYK